MLKLTFDGQSKCRKVGELLVPEFDQQLSCSWPVDCWPATSAFSGVFIVMHGWMTFFASC